MGDAMKPAAPAQQPLGFRAQTRAATRGSGYLLGAIGIVAVAAWAGMDVILQPANAKLFIVLRCFCVAGMAVICALLRTSLGERRPEALVLALVSLPQIAIAIMVSRLHGAYSAYATGFSLAIYASALLLIWQWTYTAALIGLTWAALVAALLISPRPPGTHELTTVGLYLATASVLSVAGQWYRSLLARQAFMSRLALESEQARSRDLLARLERLSRQDELTGLANRRSWDEALGTAFVEAQANGRPLAVALCDLDYFKQVNDEHGHLAGDDALKQTASMLSARVRGCDLVARLGGDEFAVLLPDTGHAIAVTLTERLAQGGANPVSFSVGVAVLQPSDRTPDDLMARADAHLYTAKRRRGSDYGAQAA
jgi:diguanylate cyclase (GGDEF)-like protein